MERLTSIMLIVATLAAGTARGIEGKTAYPEIPRIDVHTHAGGDSKAVANYLALREQLKATHGADLAMWVNLGGGDHPITDPADVLEASKGRMLSCISDYSSHDGLSYVPAELGQWAGKGFVGYKIWAGPPARRLKPGQKGFPYIDDPAHEPTFAAAERLGFLLASIHIADPCGPWGKRTKWLPDPVEYWRNITAWRNVMERHPNLNVVCAHGLWAVCQDAQIDYLRNMLATFPRMKVDLAATFQYFDLVTYENLRSFMIEYADRILFGTDIGRWDNPARTEGYAQQYWRAFRILETDETVPGGFFSRNEIRGLALPREVLAKIYYQNAMKTYPRVKDQLNKLGYAVE
ncbi:MAG: amidohydrolase family protein [Sedimentisphaerales bacterium]|nr:amidohydrolase family protein [Sedimentisphaerales bacterium]